MPAAAASAWIAESTTPSASSAKSPHGSNNETPPAPASNGCSQPKKPAPKWAAPTPSRPKSHNHCAKVLVAHGREKRTGRPIQKQFRESPAPLARALFHSQRAGQEIRPRKAATAELSQRVAPLSTDLLLSGPRTRLRPACPGTRFSGV